MTATVEEQEQVIGSDDLGAQAYDGLNADTDGPVQDALVQAEEGQKVKFLGVSYNDVKNSYHIGDKVRFYIEGEVTGDGHDKMHDGHIRTSLKVAVSLVEPA
jgi:hypothetical protein